MRKARCLLLNYWKLLKVKMWQDFLLSSQKRNYQRNHPHHKAEEPLPTRPPPGTHSPIPEPMLWRGGLWPREMCPESGVLTTPPRHLLIFLFFAPWGSKVIDQSKAGREAKGPVGPQPQLQRDIVSTPLPGSALTPSKQSSENQACSSKLLPCHKPVWP